jgi:hypothetical protein
MNKYINAFLAGITIGVLIAPRKGAATRRRLLDKLEEFNDIITDEEPAVLIADKDYTPAARVLESPIAPLK